MRHLKNRGLAVRLWAGFGVMMALLLAVAGFSLDRMQRYQHEVDALVSGNIGTLDAIALMQDSLGQRSLLLRDLVLNDSLAVQRSVGAKLKAQASVHAEALARIQSLADGAREAADRDRARDILAQHQRVAALEKTLLEQVADARFDEAKAMLAGTMTPPLVELQRMLRQFFVADMADANRSVERNQRNYRLVVLLVAAMTVAAVAIGAGVAFFTTRSIAAPLAQAREAALQVAQGDLTRELVHKGGDEIAQVVGALEWMRSSLTDAVTEIRNAAQAVSTGALQIERGNATLAERTEEQASSLEETASAIEELTATVKQNADGAGQASSLARDTTGVASRGGAAVRGVVSTMQGISDSSKRIADIIGVIDGIAFQTNILALNAAVEAARAGEQGRGFAVVAAEVRSLAQRSAQAAKEIKTLIQESTSRVDGGVREVQAAGATMDEIVASVNRVSQLIAQIAAASSEQLGGIEQVNRAIAQMDHNTQQNATLVEEAAASARHMARQAEVLVGTVAKFQLQGDRPGSGEQRHVAAGGGGVDGQRLLGAEAVQVMRPAGLGAGA